jgi:hypothetical protein
MDYSNSMRSIGMGIGFSLMLGIINGVSTYVLKDGATISEVAVEKFGGQ